MSAVSKVRDFCNAAANTGCWSKKRLNSSDPCPSLGKYRSRVSTLSISYSTRNFPARCPISFQEMGRPARDLRSDLFDERPLVLCGIDLRPELDFV
jgi:hypothetical protein